jgi:DNA-binding NarL/FixJ family response regulator
MSAVTLPIAIVDDHHLVILGLRALFHNRPEVEIVAYAHDAEAALDVCRARRPRVAVIDAVLDGSELDGFELCRRLGEELPDIACVVYTGRSDLNVTEQAYAAGATAVVSKSEEPADLIRAVLLASRGHTYTSPAFLARAGRRSFPELTPKQLAALRLLAQGLDRKEIAERMDIGEETVKSHLTRARRKLGASTSPQAVAIGLINSLFTYPADGESVS